MHLTLIKLSDPNISSKNYWFIFKSFLMGENVPCIQPIFHESRFITNFRGKADLFNSSLANQCLVITNGSILSLDYELFTDQSLTNITFTDNVIGRIIWGLDPMT